MAKRRTINRSSKRFSKNKSNDSISSRFLDPDTSIISEEQTHWWKNLDENMSLSHSLIHNSGNETPQQLNLNSELESNHNISQWWKHLESPNSRSNTSRRSKPNLSAAINTANVLETSTSESEKELSLRKRKVPLRVASRKSDSKAFLDALNNTEVAIPIKWRLKQTQYSNLYNNSDKEISKKKLDENKKDDSNLSLSPSSNILKLKPHIFKRRKGGETSGENPFQDIVKEGDSLNARRKSITFEKESSKHSIHQNINTNKDQTDDQKKIIQVSQTLPLENNEAGPSNLSTSNTVFENNVAFDINKTVETSDESDFEISKRKRFKFKSHLMQRARRSMSNDPFKDALAENRDITSSKHNEDKEVVIDGAQSPLKTPTKLLSSPSKKIVNRSRGKIDVTHENVIASSPIRRSPRSLKTTKKYSLDITRQVEENIEQNTSTSLDSNEFHFKRPAHLKLKSKIPILHKNSLTNPFEEILKQNGNARQSNIAMSPEDNHISVEQDQIIAEISQEHEQIMEENYSRSKTGSVSEDFNTSLKISSSNSAENVSENFNVQSNRLSENDDIMNVSKSNSQRNVIIEDRSKDRSNKSPKKRFSFNRKSIRDISEISKDHTNAISPANRTNTNKIEACKIINDHKSFIAKDASSTLNVQNLLTSQVAMAENFEKIKAEVDRLKIREMAAMKMAVEKKESALKTTTVKLFGATRKQSMKKNISPKVVDKAYLVNGKVYKPPRLPRPKHWATDHLYKFLWKRLEPKYQLSTRVRSEKFVVLLSKIVSIIERRKKYENYKLELDALMKEMARLNIINTRNDFHHFCQDFLPYEFRIKVIPMLLPGNKQNIPFDPEKLHIPLLEET